MRLYRLAMCVALAASAATPCLAATLRSDTILHDGVVRLSDLFDGVENDRPIGPAPDLGGRILVEAAQLNAIARQFNVDWRSTAPTDRTVIERPGQPFPREALMEALRTALATAGVSADADVQVPGLAPPLLPVGVAATAEVSQLEYDAASGRFTALLSLMGPDLQPVHARLSGRVQEMVDLPVAARRLLPGDVVGPGDLRTGRVRADTVRTEVARLAAQVTGLAVRHPVAPGAPFLVADLGRPLAVQKGETVQMSLEFPGLQVAAQGLAMEGGALGERVRVLNTTSRAVLEAEVTGTGRVRITGAAPLQLPGTSPLPVRVAAR